jgi:hypothetical protein
MPSLSGINADECNRSTFQRRHPRKRMTQYAVPLANYQTPVITGYPPWRV